MVAYGSFGCYLIACLKIFYLLCENGFTYLGIGRRIRELHSTGGDQRHSRHSQRSLPLALPEAVQ
jgi:hypothetical protein